MSDFMLAVKIVTTIACAWLAWRLRFVQTVRMYGEKFEIMLPLRTYTAKLVFLLAAVWFALLVARDLGVVSP